MPFVFKDAGIDGLILVIPQVFRDKRGFFMERFKHSDFAKASITEHFVQDNHSKSAKDVLRGMHYQKEPSAQGKLVYCIKGKIFDVVVDIRKGSPSFGKWRGIDLSDENDYMLYVPKGFAHGFLVLSDEATVIYKCTGEYSKENERGIIWNDPVVNINWPVESPVLSDKDKQFPLLKNADINFEYRSETI